MYQSLDVNWASEMFGYNMAGRKEFVLICIMVTNIIKAAHLGIKHEAVTELQVRDVDGERSFERCKDKISIHMGRAWFPKGDKRALRWIHTEGRSFSHFGDQVFCKCNFTASTVEIWPIPDKLDFVSTITLNYLHYSKVELGPVFENEQFRHKNLNDLAHSYHWAHP